MIPEGKTPISYLQEICNKKGLTPQYDVLASEGKSIHQPEFVMQVIVENNIASGKGSSKKKAKHEAARNLLKLLVGDSEELADKKEDTEDDSNSSGQNPIGELQEFTQKHHLKPPEFEYSESQPGPPADVEFNCICRLSKHTEKGTGPSKKQAKRNAAQNMLTYVRSLDSVKAEVIQDEEEEDDDLQLMIDVKNKIDQAKRRRKDLNISNSDIEKHVTEFYKNIAKRDGKSTLNAATAKIELSYKEMLADVARIHHFVVQYHDMNNKSKSGQYQCLCELSIQPIAVVHGTGSSQSESHNQAALHMLEYLQLKIAKL